MSEKHIEIEQMLFGDYRVQVWDEHLNSLLDREYFCRGYISALMTAKGIQESLFEGLPIYVRDIEGVKQISAGITVETQIENHEMDEPKTE